MIEIRLSDRTYEYDIRSLSQAFFKGEMIKVIDINDEIIQEELRSNNSKNTQCDDKYIFSIITNIDRIELYLINDVKGIDTSCIKELSNEFENVQDDLEYKSKYKNELKKTIYMFLSDCLGVELPWGTLTGIRPTKIVMEKIEQGLSDEAIEQYMIYTYLADKEKVDLSLSIAHKEKIILDEIDYKNGYSLYIGIPFCPTRCSYCSFTSYPLEKHQDVVDAYLQALFKEMEYASTMITKKKLTTVYIGGGTPTTLSAKQLSMLIDKIKEYWDFTTVREFTVEAGRPDSISRDKLEVLKKKGVTRISINPQTMRQETLDLIGRKHTIESVIDAYNLAREVGHDNINMDLILGLPGETIDDVKYTLERINELQPDSLTVHTLAIKRAAYLNIYKDKYEHLLPEHVVDMVDVTLRYAKEHNYNPYYLYRQKNMTDNLENIGYAKEGKEGIYNILIMEERQTILALGAGAVCKFVDYDRNRLERLDNVKSLKDYIERIDDMIDKKKRFHSIKGCM